MEKRKQLRGNCQCCGRQHAVLASGRVSKHGYTVKDGWFNGVCTGEHYRPLQKDRAKTDAIVATVRAECVALEATAASYREGKAHPERVRRIARVPGADPTVAWDDAFPWEQSDGLTTAIHKIENRIRIDSSFANYLEDLAIYRHSQPLLEVEVETGPAPIQIKEVRKSQGGAILTVLSVRGPRVYWISESGRKGWTGTAAWRRYEVA